MLTVLRAAASIALELEVVGLHPTRHGDILGAVSATADWTFPWAYGIAADNRGQALWFE